MRYIQTCKAIRMDYKTLEQLKETNRIIETIAHELDELAREDSNYKDIANDAWNASACLDDFLEAYKREVSSC